MIDYREIRKITAAAVAVALAGTAAAQELRCGTELIGEGDSVEQLLEACGEPDIGDIGLLEFGEWTYNFGPDEFMMRVTIRDGEVERIERLGYGYVEEQPDETM